MISSEELSKIWTEVVDFVRDSQIKCAADLEYLKYGDPTGPVYLQTFTSKKMRRVVEFCNDWLLLGIKNIEKNKIIQIHSERLRNDRMINLGDSNFNLISELFF